MSAKTWKRIYDSALDAQHFGAFLLAVVSDGLVVTDGTPCWLRTSECDGAVRYEITGPKWNPTSPRRTCRVHLPSVVDALSLEGLPATVRIV
jgi:hypothetical protein